MKGRYHWNQISAGGSQRSVDHFQSALRKDPGFALAHAGLADSYCLLGFFDLLPPAEAMPKAKESAMKALEIDGGLAEAYASLANVLKVYDRDWLAAETAVPAGAELNPNYVHGYRGYAALLAATGRFRGVLDPDRDKRTNWTRCRLWSTWRWRGRTSWPGSTTRRSNKRCGLRTWSRSIHPRNISWVSPTSRRGNSRRRGARSSVLSRARKAIPSGVASLGTPLRRHRPERRSAPHARSIEPACRAQLCGSVLAFDCPRRAWRRGCRHRASGAKLRESDVWLVWLNTDPRVDSLLADPRFQQFLRRIGFGAQTASA